MKGHLKIKYIEAILHTLIWGMLLLLPYAVSTAENDYRIGPIPGTFFTISGFIHMAIFYGNAFFLYPKLFNKRFWPLYIIAACLLLVASFRLKYYIMVWWFPGLLKDITAYRFVFGPSVAAFVVSLLYRWILNKITYEQEQKEKQAQQLSTELKFLRSQISPHFLFNVLTNLVSLARKKSDQLETSLIMLAELMRYMLYDAGGVKVPLVKEITYLKSYIALQQLRFGTDVDIISNITLDGNADACTIEPMLLIPFVENAFKHGTGVQHPVIAVRLTVNAALLTFEVTNEYDSFQDSSKDESSGIGLANVQSRLDLLYKNNHTLAVTNDNNRFHITLTLKLI